jgi:hypothetical protein
MAGSDFIGATVAAAFDLKLYDIPPNITTESLSLPMLFHIPMF